jgi:hypothetical protein
MFDCLTQINTAVGDSLTKAEFVAYIAENIDACDSGDRICYGMQYYISIAVAFQGGSPSNTMPPRISFFSLLSKSNL